MAPQADLFVAPATASGAKVNGRKAGQQINEPELDERELSLLNALGYDPLSVDLLAERTGLGIGDLSAQLIGLEIKGLVQQSGACYLRT